MPKEFIFSTLCIPLTLNGNFVFKIKLLGNIFVSFCDLGNKEPIFFACNPKQVYGTILKSWKNNDLFQNRQIYSRRNLEIS